MSEKSSNYDNFSMLVSDQSGQSREGAGRPEYSPTEQDRRIAEGMSSHGVPREQIAIVLGVSLKTMCKYLKKELIIGKAKANSAMGQSIFTRGIEGDTPAAIWWSKSQMGWKDRSK